MGREEGGGFRMGNTCIPVADSCRYMEKPIRYCKVKKKKREYKGWATMASAALADDLNSLCAGQTPSS